MLNFHLMLVTPAPLHAIKLILTTKLAEKLINWMKLTEQQHIVE